MRIIHIMLSNFYYEGYSYQENLLPQEQAKEGNEIKIIASLENCADGIIYEDEEKRYVNEFGIEVVRIRARNFISKKIGNKLRYFPDALIEIQNFNPDLIFMHGIQGAVLTKVSKYCEERNIPLFADVHSSFNNSAKKLLSREILHKIIYKRILQKCIKNIDTIFYLTEECHEFVTKLYKIDERKLEYLPLGGFFLDDKEYLKKRTIFRDTYKIADNQLLISDTGKLVKEKKTIDLVKAFIKKDDDNQLLYIGGFIPDSLKDEMMGLINSDSRIKYLGWLNNDEIISLLCATDLYAQPGTQSATMQEAVCLRCNVLLQENKAHKFLLDKIPYYASEEDEIYSVLKSLEKDSVDFVSRQEKLIKLAEEKLDYKKQSELIIEKAKKSKKEIL